MSVNAFASLVDAGLIDNSGKIVDLSRLSPDEISLRINQYISGRIQTAENEVEQYEATNKLSALFSTSSTNKSSEKILSSALVYESMILDDPLVSSSSSISLKTLKEGLEFFSWARPLIMAGFVKILPLSFFNRPNNEIPLLYSDDAFRSAIPTEIHDFIHSNAILKSVKPGKEGSMLVLPEEAHIRRRPALNVEFKDDYWRRGVSLYLFQTIEDKKLNEHGHLLVRPTWNPKQHLTQQEFDRWSYQTINQAMRVRLTNIYSETSVATRLGHTYVTESNFEARLLSMAGIQDSSSTDHSAKFLEANNSFIKIDSPETIIELRTKFGSAFERFNLTLMHVTAVLSDVALEDFDRRAKMLFHAEILPQIDELRSNLGSLSKAAIAGGFVSLTGLAAAVATGTAPTLIQSLMLAAAGGLTGVLPLVSPKQYSKKTPAYIWHRVLK